MKTKYSEKEVERILALQEKATGPDLYVLAALAGEIFTACDQLAAAREIVNRQARFILHEVKWDAWGGDWACAQCHPNSDMLAQGFVCCYHEALRLTEESSDE